MKFSALLVLFILCAFTHSSFAGEVGVDFTQNLRGVGNEPITIGGKDCHQGQIPGRDCSQVPMTLGDAAVGALETTLAQDAGEDPTKKFARDALARKVYENKHAILSPEEVSTIKDRIGRVWGAAQVGATWPLLDPSLAVGTTSVPGAQK